MSLTTTRVYRWDDPDAPALTGQAGSLITLLRACLVGTSGVAYGTGENEKQAAGWSEPFSPSGNKAVFRNALAAGGTGMYFQVLDDGSGTGGGREAFGRSYLDMTDLDTGTHPAPSPSQLSTGNVLRKSATTDTTERGWVLVADERTFYLSVICNAEGNYDQRMIGAGDFLSYVPADPGAYFSMGSSIQNSSYSNNNQWGLLNPVSYNAPNPGSGLFAGSNYSKDFVSTAMQCINYGTTGNAEIGRGPLPSDSSVYKKMYIPLVVQSNNFIRGALRGLLVPLNNISGEANGTIESNPDGVPVGTDILIVSAGSNYTNICRVGIIINTAWS